eukprot:TRINITY_DN10340_c0_g1_i2.p1 TRINITY_DN10340_c0_g1~~TRINITY_DN10340_c0_g1_i2.p1  ORF type:complete len:469 (+),score=79.54 TRINITY_DN10340_c0_g1_i2:66-1409(+)
MSDGVPTATPAAAAPAEDSKPQPAGGQDGQKKKSEMTRKERAALQDEQRRQKAMRKEQEQRAKTTGVTIEKEKPKKETRKEPKPKQKAASSPDAKKAVAKKKKKRDDISSLHPAVLELGERYKDHSIIGGNARCMALMQCIRQMVVDYCSPEKGTHFRDDFQQKLKKPIHYLSNCRRFSFSMLHGQTFVQNVLQSMPHELTLDESRTLLMESIDGYCRNILMVTKEIAERCVGAGDNKKNDHQLRENDVVMTFGRSQAVEWVFRLAHSKKINFEVIVVDSRPLHEGRAFSIALSKLGIPTTYCLLSSIQTLLPRCTKVFVGASAMLTNGSLVNRIGTATVCTLAKHFGRPVLCFCEKYKFADKVWLGSLTNNEEASSTSLLTLMNGTPSPLSDSIDSDCLSLVNYMYDVTPAEAIDVVMTEIGPMPPTSVPVIVRERISGKDDGGEQ